MANQSGLLAKVSFVTKISTLMKATSDDGQPVQGYLYSEVSNMTLESEDHCENCLDFMVKRLEDDSPRIKIKVLKLMEYIVKNGNPNFKLGLLKKSRGIQEATKCSGSPDPLCGMEPYIQTRKTAQGLLEVLFNTDKEGVGEDSGAQTKSPPKVMTGIGSHSYQSPPGQTRMEGFGNVLSSPERSFGDSLKDSFFKMMDKMAESPVDHQRELLSTVEGNTGYKALMEATVECSSPLTQAPVETQTPRQVSPPKHVPGRAGGGWEDSDEEEPEPRPKSQSTDSGPASLADRLDNATLEDFTAEQNIILGYVDNCDDSMLKRSQLKSFLKDCASHNCDKIVEFLNVRISSSDEEASVMKSLMLLEALMSSDLVNLERLTSVCREGLVSVYKTKTGPPNSKARKLIRILEKLTSQTNIMQFESQDPQLVSQES